MRSARRWPAGDPLTTKIAIFAKVPGPAGKAPDDPMEDFLVRFPNGYEDRLSAMFLCPADPPFANCNCSWHPS